MDVKDAIFSRRTIFKLKQEPVQTTQLNKSSVTEFGHQTIMSPSRASLLSLLNASGNL